MIKDNTKLAEIGRIKTYRKGELIFSENSKPSCFFQIKKGLVKMITFNEDGKEVIQKIFQPGQSFGEPPLIAAFPYPARAVAITNTEIWVIPQRAFMVYIKENPEILYVTMQTVCKRICYKAQMIHIMSINNSKDRILSFFNLLMKEAGENPERKSMEFEIPYTRQQISDHLALRVETVIRAVKELEADGELQIIDRKIYRKWQKCKNVVLT